MMAKVPSSYSRSGKISGEQSEQNELDRSPRNEMERREVMGREALSEFKRFDSGPSHDE
jgi:hypothetical protein